MRSGHCHAGLAYVWCEVICEAELYIVTWLFQRLCSGSGTHEKRPVAGSASAECRS
jgi:hypothetical protein